MSAVSPIIAGVDGSPQALDAVRWAAAEARSLHCAVHVMHASVWSMAGHPVPSAVPAGHRQTMLEKAQLWVHEAANAARAAAPGVEVIERLVVGEPAAVLIGESRNAREVVVASHGLDGPDSALLGGSPGRPPGGSLGPIALRLTQHAGCPVVVVGHPMTNDPDGPVVVGVDGSAGSDGAVEFAVEFAARCDVPLVALHAWSDIRLSAQQDTIWQTLTWETVAADEERWLVERLAGWQDKYPEVEVRRVVTRDRPVRCLIEVAEQAGLLVVGARGRGGIPGVLLGSTSHALLDQAPCPVAIVR